MRGEKSENGGKDKTKTDERGGERRLTYTTINAMECHPNNVGSYGLHFLCTYSCCFY